MSDINIPVLVISGQSDKRLSSKFLHDEFANCLPLVHFKEIWEAGNLLPAEAHADVASLIRNAVYQGEDCNIDVTKNLINFLF